MLADSQWTPDAVVRILTELGAVVIGIIGAWRGVQANAKADALSESLARLAARLQDLQKSFNDTPADPAKPADKPLFAPAPPPPTSRIKV